MLNRLFVLAVAGSLSLACSGCRIVGFSISSYEHRPRPVRVTHVVEHPVHVCSQDCHDHYWDGAQVVVISGGHRHGPQCGHHWNSTHWVVVKKSKVKRIHIGPKKVKKIKIKHVHGV
jgi:hypothetical protein